MFAIWAFAGLIVDLGDGMPAAGAYFVSIIICFIMARVVQISLEVIMATHKNIILTIVKWTAGFIALFICEGLVILWTINMDKEFKHYGWVTVICLALDLFVWEFLSAMGQLVVTLVLQAGKLKGSAKSVCELLVTPPVLWRAIK